MKQPILCALMADEYRDDLWRGIRRAETRIGIVTLNMMYDDSTADIFHELERAAERGVDVRLAVDNHTYLELADKPIGRVPTTHKSGDETRAAFDRLKASGARVTMLGPTKKFNSYRGRMHAKWTVVDDVTYGFGGVNIYHHGFSNHDIMVKVVDEELSDDMWREQGKVSARGTYEGFEKQYPWGRVYIDSGRPKDSPIYDRALDLVKHADSVVYISQFMPSGSMRRALHRTGSTEQYANHARQVAPTRASRAAVIATSLINRGKNQYSDEKYIHAKCIVATAGDVTTVLTGSHNFSPSGVRAGTVECALETTNPTVITAIMRLKKRLQT